MTEISYNKPYEIYLNTTRMCFLIENQFAHDPALHDFGPSQVNKITTADMAAGRIEAVISKMFPDQKQNLEQHTYIKTGGAPPEHDLSQENMYLIEKLLNNDCFGNDTYLQIDTTFNIIDIITIDFSTIFNLIHNQIVGYAPGYVFTKNNSYNPFEFTFQNISDFYEFQSDINIKINYTPQNYTLPKPFTSPIQCEPGILLIKDDITFIKYNKLLPIIETKPEVYQIFKKNLLKRIHINASIVSNYLTVKSLIRNTNYKIYLENILLGHEERYKYIIYSQSYSQALKLLYQYNDQQIQANIESMLIVDQKILEQHCKDFYKSLYENIGIQNQEQLNEIFNFNEADWKLQLPIISQLITEIFKPQDQYYITLKNSIKSIALCIDPLILLYNKVTYCEQVQCSAVLPDEEISHFTCRIENLDTSELIAKLIFKDEGFSKLNEEKIILNYYNETIINYCKLSYNYIEQEYEKFPKEIAYWALKRLLELGLLELNWEAKDELELGLLELNWEAEDEKNQNLIKSLMRLKDTQNITEVTQAEENGNAIINNVVIRVLSLYDVDVDLQNQEQLNEIFNFNEADWKLQLAYSNTFNGTYILIMKLALQIMQNHYVWENMCYNLKETYSEKFFIILPDNPHDLSNYYNIIKIKTIIDSFLTEINNNLSDAETMAADYNEGISLEYDNQYSHEQRLEILNMLIDNIPDFEDINETKKLITIYINVKSTFDQHFDNIFTNFVTNLMFSKEEIKEDTDIEDILNDPKKLLENYNTAATASSHAANHVAQVHAAAAQAAQQDGAQAAAAAQAAHTASLAAAQQDGAYTEKQYKNSEFLKNILINFLFNLNDVQLNLAASLFKDLGVSIPTKGGARKKEYIFMGDGIVMRAIDLAVKLPYSSRIKFSKIITKLDQYIQDSSYPTVEKAKMQSNGSIYWKFDINKFYTFYSKNIKTEITPEIIDTILQNFDSFPLYLSDSFVESLEFNKQTAKLIFNEAEFNSNKAVVIEIIGQIVNFAELLAELVAKSSSPLNLEEFQTQLSTFYTTFATIRIPKLVNTEDKLKSIKKKQIQEAILALEQLDEIETLYFNIETLESGIGQMVQDIYLLGYFLQVAPPNNTLYENLSAHNLSPAGIPLWQPFDINIHKFNYYIFFKLLSKMCITYRLIIEKVTTGLNTDVIELGENTKIIAGYSLGGILQSVKTALQPVLDEISLPLNSDNPSKEKELPLLLKIQDNLIKKVLLCESNNYITLKKLGFGNNDTQLYKEFIKNISYINGNLENLADSNGSIIKDKIDNDESGTEFYTNNPDNKSGIITKELMFTTLTDIADNYNWNQGAKELIANLLDSCVNDDLEKVYINNAVTAKEELGFLANNYFCPIASIMDNMPQCSSVQTAELIEGIEYGIMDIIISNKTSTSESSAGKIITYRIRVEPIFQPSATLPHAANIGSYLKIGDEILINIGAGMVEGLKENFAWPDMSNLSNHVQVPLIKGGVNPLDAKTCLKNIFSVYEFDTFKDIIDNINYDFLISYLSLPSSYTKDEIDEYLQSIKVTKNTIPPTYPTAYELLRDAAAARSATNYLLPHEMRRMILEKSFLKGLGDTLQELTGITKNGGYVDNYNTHISGFKQGPSPANQIRLQLSNDRPSGIRAIFLLLFGSGDMKDNAVAGYLTKNKFAVTLRYKKQNETGIAEGNKKYKRKKKKLTKKCKNKKKKLTKKCKNKKKKLTKKRYNNKKYNNKKYKDSKKYKKNVERKIKNKHTKKNNKML